MIVLENGLYVVILPEHFLHQDRDPANGQPFASEVVAQAWQDSYLAAAAAAQAARAAEVAAAAPVRLEERRAQKIAAIRAHFGGLVDGLKADCAPYEVDTWPVQTAEFSAWTANSAAPTPYVAALAAARGITLAALMDKIGIKVVGLASLQGVQQALEDAVKAAATEAEVEAVVF